MTAIKQVPLSDVHQVIDTSITSLDPELRAINHAIHSNPELGYAEFEAHKNVVAFLRTQDGVRVTPHAYGLETAFEAEYGAGGRVVAVNVEYDALPGIGHACGHNIIATGSLAAFLGIVGAIKKYGIEGRVRAIGTPAEEGGGGKIKLIDAGAYKDVEACMMTHPNVHGITYISSVASAKFQAAFTGRPAHAAAAPQDGINALDAAVLAYNGISMLRQQILPQQRIHGIIMEGGEKANIIPSRAVMDYNVRGLTLRDTKVLQRRVVKCFQGAAIATGCTVEFKEHNNYAEMAPNRKLCIEYSKLMAGLGAPQLCTADKQGSVPEHGSFSTDQGNVSHICPSIHPIYVIPSDDNASNHTKQFTKAAITDEAYQRTLITSRGMAGTAWRFLTDDQFAGDVKNEFEEAKKVRDAGLGEVKDVFSSSLDQ